MAENEMVHGFKVFGHEWDCRGKIYTCPGKFEEEGNISVCNRGMHFCEKLIDCFDYYDFDQENHVAEVIAYGQVKREGNKCCTDKLNIIREIPWEEVLKMVNTGDRNTGNRNTGNCNTGNRNTGDRNTGDRNTGYRNTGDWNTGDWNTGYRNTGDWNTGDWNTGDRNTGNWNTGDWNTGDRNTGNWNTGNRNTGYRNTGDWNKSSYNTGCFMTEEPTIYLFNKPSDWFYKDWINSDARYLLDRIPKNVVCWICTSDMTDEEKNDHPEYETTGGYLKVLDESDCAQLWWDKLEESNKAIIKALPNFDPEIFEQCTGIHVD